MKLDIIRENPRVCGTVIEDLGYRHGECSHSYRSVIVYGSMSEVLDPAEKKLGIMTMIEHLEKDPHTVKERLLGKDIDYTGFSVMKLLIEEKTGKESPPK
jgi:nitroimidazol reductase NimA-like FMN-containing flavoprotein (pyridoxamine 5'-phosphate oxidase superfamily)